MNANGMKNLKIALGAGIVALSPVVDRAFAETVKREIAVSVIGLDRPSFAPVAESVPKVIDYWIEAMDREIGNRPDLVILPECCDTVPTKTAAEKAAWIRLRGTKPLEAFKAYAAQHACYLVYAAHRERADGRFANSSILIDRRGQVAATYDKVFPTVGEVESRVCPIVPGTEAVVAETDFGRLGFAICFDLNFSELLDAYAAKKPDIIAFSSFFDGDFMQRDWARRCRSYVVSSTCASWLEKRVIDPSGAELRRENYYRPTFTARVNTNCEVLHLDFNRQKFAAVTAKYGRRISIVNPGSVGIVTLASNDPALPVGRVVREFGLETYRDYLARSRDERRKALE